MSSAEFFIMAGIILAGLIFFLIAQNFIFGEGNETKEYEYQADAQGLVSLINRISTEPASYFSYFQYISLSNITVKNNILTYEREGFQYSLQLPKGVNDIYLEETSSLCIVKSNEKITLSEECPVCNQDLICTPDECKEECPDCYSPAPICIGDDFCNEHIGENCENSIDDCPCIDTCCPDSPDTDYNGCSQTSDLERGEECWCTNQCKAGLECNPTTSDFISYEKSCCDGGKAWNGTDCIVVECKYPCVTNCIIPEKFDWRDYQGSNWLNPVRNQGRCGSCWIFSAVGATEGTYNVENNLPAANEDLSEQDIISCGSGEGCRGGFPHIALDYIQTSGMCDEACFPYQDQDTGIAVKTRVPCDSKCIDFNSREWTINSFQFVSGMENIKKALICQGPLSVGSNNWRHAIVLVAYDDDGEVWTIRNSWGIGWGNGGYGDIPYTGHQYSDISEYVYYVDGVIEP